MSAKSTYLFPGFPGAPPDVHEWIKSEYSDKKCTFAREVAIR